MGAEVAKCEHWMWKILVKLEKFAKVSKSLIKFLYFLKLHSLRDLLECSVGVWRRYAKQLDELICGKILERIYDRTNVWNLDRTRSTRLRDNRARPRLRGRPRQCAQVFIVCTFFNFYESPNFSLKKDVMGWSAHFPLSLCPAPVCNTFSFYFR